MDINKRGLKKQDEKKEDLMNVSVEDLELIKAKQKDAEAEASKYD